MLGSNWLVNIDATNPFFAMALVISLVRNSPIIARNKVFVPHKTVRNGEKWGFIEVYQSFLDSLRAYFEADTAAGIGILLRIFKNLSS